MTDNREKYLDLLRDLIAIPSVSARQEGQLEAAQLVGQAFAEAGAEVIIDETYPAPFVLGKFLSHDSAAKTLVIYNHYDVQPEDPIALWATNPFELVAKEGKLFGRGVADDKGHITARLNAIVDYREAHGDWPVNIFFLVEGAEESGSTYFREYLAKYATEFADTDLVIWESGEVRGADRLEVLGGNKGIITFTLTSETANRDLHSSFATVVDSATWRLIAALNSLRTPAGAIAIDGLYDDAILPNERENELVRSLDVRPTKIKQDFGLQRPLLSETTGEDFYDNLYFKSNLNIEGIQSGYQGAGVKTVTPATASAKLEIRLVPGQIPEDIFQKVVAQLAKNGFDDIQAELTLATPGYRSDMTAPRIQALIALGQRLYSEVEVTPTSPGTGPMYWANEYIQAPIAAVGLAYHDSLVHAPNENIRVADYDKHVELIQALIGSYEVK